MKISSPFQSGLLDVLTGFLGFVFFMVLVFATNIKFDLRWFFIVGGLLCAALGFLRGRSLPRKAWVKGLLIISGMAVPAIALSFIGIAFGAQTVLVTFLVISALLAVCGVRARQKWTQKKPVIGVTFLLIRCLLCRDLWGLSPPST